jgi:hypothetical protein
VSAVAFIINRRKGIAHGNTLLAIGVERGYFLFIKLLIL